MFIMKETATIKEKVEAKERFENMMRTIVSVSKDEIKEREKAEKQNKKERKKNQI